MLRSPFSGYQVSYAFQENVLLLPGLHFIILSSNPFAKFLMCSRADPKKYADLNQLAQQFLEGVQQSSSGRQNVVPSLAYVEGVVEEIRQGATMECPICLESASDDPVLTPCAHRMCGECLVSSWRTPDGGPCPLCRRHISKSDLIILPAQSRFQVDAKNNWKDSCKVKTLVTMLESLQRKQEKSIVFSQFTSFFDLLEIRFTQKGIKFLRFDGKLSQKHKEKVLKEFSESQDKLVCLSKSITMILAIFLCTVHTFSFLFFGLDAY
jgi:DNA repair protein RAD5